MTSTAMSQSQIAELKSQIGGPTVMAVSGGRTMVKDGALVLYAGPGYRVVVELAADDTYTVKREYVRSGKTFDKGVFEGVYCDEISEAVWIASCYRSYPKFGSAA